VHHRFLRVFKIPENIPNGIFKKPALPRTTGLMLLVLPDKSTRRIKTDPLTLETLLLAEGINPLEVIVSRNGNLITEDTIVAGDDEIRIIRISHGG
jgi:sulfur carrier protein